MNFYTPTTIKRVFVCSPLRADSAEDFAHNQAVARAWCRQIALEGKAPFAPHLLYPQFLDDSLENERDAGIRAGVAFLFSCHSMLVDGRAGISSGMEHEIKFAERYGLMVTRIFYGHEDIPLPRPAKPKREPEEG